MSRAHHLEHTLRKENLRTNAVKTRYRFSNAKKKEIMNICLANKGIPHSDIGIVNRCTSSQISKWMKKRLDMTKWREKPGDTQPVEKKGRFKESEVELYDRFLDRRLVTGLYVDGIWLKNEMKQILSLYRPIGYKKFKYSNGWLSRFCKLHTTPEKTKNQKPKTNNQQP